MSWDHLQKIEAHFARFALEVMHQNPPLAGARSMTQALDMLEKYKVKIVDMLKKKLVQVPLPRTRHDGLQTSGVPAWANNILGRIKGCSELSPVPDADDILTIWLTDGWYWKFLSNAELPMIDVEVGVVTPENLEKHHFYILQDLIDHYDAELVRRGLCCEQKEVDVAKLNSVTPLKPK